jgi:hypothetical protein
MTCETFSYRDKIPNRLDAQFSLIRVPYIPFRCRNRDEQTGTATVLDLI